MATNRIFICILLLVSLILASGSVLDGIDSGDGIANMTGSLVNEDSDGDMSDLLKRWYSINTAPPVPLTANSRSAWPVVCPQGPRWIRYCFKDESSRDNLLTILLHAIARWGPAMDPLVSSFNIQPDLACHGDYDCLCYDANGYPKTNDDTLVIRDGMKDSNYANRELASQATLGYYFNVIPMIRGQHDLIMSFYNLKDPKSMPFDEAVVFMMHELGHVAGLSHEHQRPDAAALIDIHPEHIENYEDALEYVESHVGSEFDPSDDGPARIHKVINDPELAEEFWPEALDFGPEPYMPAFQSSPGLDFRSIMIYPSNHMSPDRTKHTMTRKHPKPDGDITFWEGDNPISSLASISPGDIQRISMLYPPLGHAIPYGMQPAPLPNPLPQPPPPAKRRDEAKHTSQTIDRSKPVPLWNFTWNPVRVVIPNTLTTTVSMAPSYGAKEIARASRHNYRASVRSYSGDIESPDRGPTKGEATGTNLPSTSRTSKGGTALSETYTGPFAVSSFTDPFHTPGETVVTVPPKPTVPGHGPPP